VLGRTEGFAGAALGRTEDFAGGFDGRDFGGSLFALCFADAPFEGGNDGRFEGLAFVELDVVFFEGASSFVPSANGSFPSTRFAMRPSVNPAPWWDATVVRHATAAPPRNPTPPRAS
jgi:hypothetical protein